MEIQPIHLSTEYFKSLQNKKIGYGTDGSVYKYNKKELIKIYHTNLYRILSCIDVKTDEDIRIYNKEKRVFPVQSSVTAYFYNQENDEHLRLPAKDAVRYAISRQKNITMTQLPKNMVYVDKIFAGILIDRVNGIQIHKLTGLPLNIKKKIMFKIIERVRELISNNIYHIDLNNSPFSKKTLYVGPSGELESVGHSHILVDHTLEPHLIDLDGKSTIYTEKKSIKSEQMCLKGLCQLLIEFLLEIDLDELEGLEDSIDYLCDLLEHAKVASEYIESLSEYNLNIQEIEEVVKTLK